MPITFARCKRCGFPMVWDSNPCRECGKIDNDFCQHCHKYNHKNNPLFKIGGRSFMTDVTREAKHHEH